MRRTLAGVVLLMFLASCSQRAEVRVVPTDELPRDLYGSRTSQSVSSRMIRALMYFVATDETGKPLQPERLTTTWRQERSDRSLAEFAVRALLARPLASETNHLRTAIPPGTTLLGVTVRSGIADVNLSAQFEQAEAEVLQLLRVAQVVWTLTEVPRVHAVRFRIHGAPQPVIDQFGVAHEIVTRARYSRLAPHESTPPDTVPGLVAPDSPQPTSTSER